MYLSSVLGFRLVDKMHQEEHIIGKVMLFHNVYLKTTRYRIKKVLAHTTNKACRLEIIFDCI